MRLLCCYSCDGSVRLATIVLGIILNVALMIVMITATSPKDDFSSYSSSFRHRRRTVREIRIPFSDNRPRTLQQETEMTAESACQASIPTEEAAGIDFGAVCDCRPGQKTWKNHAILTCQDTVCTYCKEDGSICDSFSYGVIFDAQGKDVAIFEQDEYIVGRSDTVVYTEFTGTDTEDNSCTMEVNGISCTFCGIIDCVDSNGVLTDGLQVVCDNVDDAPSFNTCNDTQFQANGVFTYFHEDFGYCYGPQEGCENDMETMADQGYTCECKVVTVTSEIPQDDLIDNQPPYELSCHLNCANNWCNPEDDFATCATETITQYYQSFLKESVEYTVTYTKGMGDDAIVRIRQSSCDQTASGCRYCQALVGDTECTSCTMHSCNQNGSLSTILQPKINCQNVNKDWTFDVDLCVAIPSISSPAVDNPFGYFVTEYQCMTNRSMACDDSKRKIQGTDPHLECSCEQSNSDAATLSCATNCGDVCRGTACFRETLLQDFDADGIAGPLQRSIQYTKGLKHTLFLSQDDAQQTCDLEVDGIQCKSCRLEMCGNGNEMIPLLDCSNIDANAFTGSCEDAMAYQHESNFLMRFSTRDLDACFDRTPNHGKCTTAEPIALPTEDSVVTLLPAYAGSTIMVDVADDTINIKSCANDEVSVDTIPGLWYTIKGTGAGLHASVCDAMTDHDAQISVFMGESCDHLDCVATASALSDQNERCSIKWHGQIGQTYFLKIHGRGGDAKDAVGNFYLTINSFDYASELCQQHKELLEGMDNKLYSCDCLATIESSPLHVLHCTNECLMCNANKTVCGLEEMTLSLDSNAGSIIQHAQSFQYLLGSRNNTALFVEQQLCPPELTSECQESCHAAVNGVSCTECKVTLCGDDSEASNGWEISCKNIDNLLNINTCNNATISPTVIDLSSTSISVTLTSNAGMANLFYQDDLAICVPKDGSLACLHKQSMQIRNNVSLECDCQENEEVDDGEYQLTCVDTSCLKCHSGVCGFATEKFEFGSNGEAKRTYKDFLILDGTSAQSLPELMKDMASADCSTIHDATQVCEMEANRIMASDSTTECLCQESKSGDGSVRLLCMDFSLCEYCDHTLSVCVEQLQFGYRINQFGHIVVSSSYHAFQFSEGRDELVVIEQESNHCTVSVNGQKCSYCERVECSLDAFLGQDSVSVTRSKGSRVNSLLQLSVDCSNLFHESYESVVYDCGSTVVIEKDDGKKTKTTSIRISVDAMDYQDNSNVLAMFVPTMEYTCRGNVTTMPTIEPFETPSTNTSKEISDGIARTATNGLWLQWTVVIVGTAWTGIALFT